MTLREVLGAIWRRWYVSVAILLCAAALGNYFGSTSGVYSTRTAVSFTFQDGSSLAPNSGIADESVIAFAGAIAADINRSRPSVRYSSMDAPYYGAGIREGVLVALRDTGSQWLSSFNSAIVEIQIVGPTQRWVEDQQALILSEIEQITAARQDSAQVPPNRRIVAEVEPITKHIEHVVPSRASVLLAWAALVGAATIVAGWLSIVVDTRMRRRRENDRNTSSATDEVVAT